MSIVGVAVRMDSSVISNSLDPGRDAGYSRQIAHCLVALAVHQDL